MTRSIGNIKHAESIHGRYSSRELSGEVWHFLRYGGQSTCEVIGRKRGYGLEVVQLCSKAAADQEAGWFASKPSHRIVYSLLIFTDNTEFNKRRSRIEAAQNCVMQ